MSITRYQTPTDLSAWTPFHRLSSLRDLLDSAFQLASVAPGATGSWAPPLDLHEDEDRITVRLELAGVKKEDFDVSLTDDVLTISGERKSEEDRREGESFRSERVFGSFSRSVTLPSPVKAGEVNAAYEDGILTVTLPKAEEARPRKIEVKVN